MLRLRTYAGTCWWCGRAADSREHKYKRTDLARIYGPGPYRDDSGPIRYVGDGRERAIQGPGSKEVKFEANLCARCNNERSQPKDYAYDRFIDFVDQHKTAILSTREFSWADVFGQSWVTGSRNVKGYYVKHAGCRLAGAGLEVPRGLVRFLDGAHARPRGLDIWLEICLDLAVVNETIDEGLWLGPVEWWRNEDTGVVTRVRSFTGYKWLRLNYSVDSRLPSTANFDTMMVELPAGYSIPPDEVRAQLNS
jgi:hypothetical protein